MNGPKAANTAPRHRKVALDPVTAGLQTSWSLGLKQRLAEYAVGAAAKLPVPVIPDAILVVYSL